MPLAAGALLALAVGAMATGVGLDRDRAFYPTVAIVVASFYDLFAVLGASTSALMLESLVAVAFVALALWGFKSSLWVVVAALAAHGLLDLVHERIIHNPGVPPWWPGFCLAYDVTASAYLAWLLQTRRIRAQAAVGRP